MMYKDKKWPGKAQRNGALSPKFVTRRSARRPPATARRDEKEVAWARVDEIWVSGNSRAFCPAASHPWKI